MKRTFDSIGIVDSHTKTSANFIICELHGMIFPGATPVALRKGDVCNLNVTVDNTTNSVTINSVSVTAAKRLKVIGSGVSNTCKGQSPKQKFDAYLVKVKHSLHDQGKKPGDSSWEETLNIASDVFNQAYGTNWNRSIDTKIWR